jgi:hypothetical protein
VFNSDNCPAGFIAGIGSPLCLACKAGYFSSIHKLNFCEGKRSSMNLNHYFFLFHDFIDISHLFSFYYSIQNTGCPIGQFQPNTNAIDCISCLPGSYTPLRKSAACLPCNPGMYQLLENKTECLDCDVMHFGNKSGLSFCSICPWGWEALTNGSAGCSTCPVGKHGDPSKTRGCHYCSEGQYRRQDDVGQLLKCRQCKYLF